MQIEKSRSSFCIKQPGALITVSGVATIQRSLRRILPQKLPSMRNRTLLSQRLKARGHSIAVSSKHVAYLRTLEISAIGLFTLDRLEERFEITFAETMRTLALNYFEEQRRSVLNRLGEDLQKITF